MGKSLFCFAVMLIVSSDIQAKTLDSSHPVIKVVKLLEDMQNTLEKEAHDDQKLYDNVSCWCTTNDKEKNASVIAEEKAIARLASLIEQLAGSEARLGAEVAALEEEISENSDALRQAAELNKKDNAEFKEKEISYLASIDAVNRAVAVLAKHPDEASLIAVEKIAKDQQKQWEMAIRHRASGRRKFRGFLQQPVASKSYNSRSGEISGILKNMSEAFQDDLKELQDENTESQKNFAGLKKAKEEEIYTSSEQLEKKKTRMQDAQLKKVEAKEDKKNTEASLSDDTKFLIKLKKRCKETDAEFEKRQKMRQEEITAVSQAIKVLDSDQAHANFGKTFNFYQLSSKSRALVSRAASVLQAGSIKSLSALSISLRSASGFDAFVSVKKAIERMVEDLQAEQEDESKIRDSCVSRLNKNESDAKRNDFDQETKRNEIETSEIAIVRLKDEITQLESEIADLLANLKTAGEDLEEGNKKFQNTIREQTETQNLLARVIDVLASVYEKGGDKISLIGTKDVGPDGFQKYEKSSGSSSVISLLRQIRADAKAMQEEAVKDEMEAQAKYEEFVNSTNVSVSEKRKNENEKRGVLADTETSLVQEQKDMANLKEKGSLLKIGEKDLEESCGIFLHKNDFNARVQARLDEIKALKEAKAYLSGAINAL